MVKGEIVNSYKTDAVLAITPALIISWADKTVVPMWLCWLASVSFKGGK